MSEYETKDDLMLALSDATEEILNREKKFSSLKAQLAEKDKQILWLQEKLETGIKLGNEMKAALVEAEKAEAELQSIAVLLECHPAFVISETETLLAKTKDVPNIDRVRQAEAELLKKDKEIQSWRDSRDGIMAENETLVAAKLEAEAELSSLREKMKGD